MPPPSGSFRPVDMDWQRLMSAQSQIRLVSEPAVTDYSRTGHKPWVAIHPNQSKL